MDKIIISEPWGKNLAKMLQMAPKEALISQKGSFVSGVEETRHVCDKLCHPGRLETLPPKSNERESQDKIQVPGQQSLHFVTKYTFTT